MHRSIIVLAFLLAGPVSADPVVRECTSLRLKGTCKEPTHGTTITTTKGLGGEKTITTTVTIEQPVMQLKNLCVANVSISYVQMNDKIRVDTEIDNDDCAASNGEYTIRARTVGPGDARTREFNESWARDDNSRVAARHEYDMAGDTRLMWVTVKTRPKTACRCVVEDTTSQ